LKVLVTGGAGFIGSHLVDALMDRGHEVRVLDNLSSGRLQNIRRWLRSPRFEFQKGDLTNIRVARRAVDGCEALFHLAAYPEVRTNFSSPQLVHKNNVTATFNLLEAVRMTKCCRVFLFASSSTVYGDARELPTPEEYTPLLPVSVYGASKLASESLLHAYGSMFKFNGVVLRLANVVGPRSRRGVIYDFVQKLKRNPAQLEVLGDGQQSKSYIYIRDCIDGMMVVFEKAADAGGVYNLGSEDRISALDIAKIVAEEMGLRGVDVRTTGGVEGGRGWHGDVKQMQLDVVKLMKLGWKPTMRSDEAVRQTVRDLLFHAT